MVVLTVLSDIFYFILLARRWCTPLLHFIWMSTFSGLVLKLFLLTKRKFLETTVPSLVACQQNKVEQIQETGVTNIVF